MKIKINKNDYNNNNSIGALAAYFEFWFIPIEMYGVPCNFFEAKLTVSPEKPHPLFLVSSLSTIEE